MTAHNDPSTPGTPRPVSLPAEPGNACERPSQGAGMADAAPTWCPSCAGLGDVPCNHHRTRAAGEQPDGGRESALHPQLTSLWWRNGEVYVGDPELGQVWFMNPIGYCDLPADATKLLPATDDVHRDWYTLSHIVGGIEDDPAEDVHERARKLVARADALQAKYEDALRDGLKAAHRAEANAERAASWHEAAKTFCRARNRVRWDWIVLTGKAARLREQRDEYRARVEAAEARTAELESSLGYWKTKLGEDVAAANRRADAAEAKLAQLLDQRDAWWEHVSKERRTVEAERDEARATLSTFMSRLGAELDEWAERDPRCQPLIDSIRAITVPVTDRREDKNDVEQFIFYRLQDLNAGQEVMDSNVFDNSTRAKRSMAARLTRWLRERGYVTDREEPASDIWCRSESCQFRNWRSGTVPTHERGIGCPPPEASEKPAAYAEPIEGPAAEELAALRAKLREEPAGETKPDLATATGKPHADDCTGCDAPDQVPCDADCVIGDVVYANGKEIKHLPSNAPEWRFRRPVEHQADSEEDDRG